MPAGLAAFQHEEIAMFRKWTAKLAADESAPVRNGEQDRTVLRKRALMRAVEERCRHQGWDFHSTNSAVTEALRIADSRWSGTRH
jgi:alkylhydroperoxidase family enzyme